MPWQLLYTSARRGLQPGHSGYCTVAHSAGLRPVLVQQLEQLSSYDHLGQTGHPPAVSAYRQVDLAGQKYHVLTRIRDAGLDFSGRSNYLAHHLVFGQEEAARLPSPAAILLLWEGWLRQWSGEPRLLADLPVTDFQAMADRSFLPARNWQSLTGDAGKAAALLSPEYARGCFLIMEPGDEDLLLALFAESLQLLNPGNQTSANAWRHTFTTFVQGQDNLADFRWRGGWRETPGYAKATQARSPVLAPTTLVAPISELAIIAREGRVPLRVTRTEVTPRPAQVLPAPDTSPPPRVRPVPITPTKPVGNLRLADRRPSSSGEADADLAPPAAPSAECPCWKTRQFWVSAVVAATVALWLAWRYFPEFKRSPGLDYSTTNELPILSPTSPPTGSTTTAQGPDAEGPRGPIWLFLGKKHTEIDLDEVRLLTNLMARVGTVLSRSNIQCFLLRTNALGTNQLAINTGEPLEISLLRRDRLHVDRHTRLGYDPDLRKVVWLERDNRDLVLHHEQTNFWVSISFAWTDPRSGQATNLSLALVNPSTGVLSRPFLFPKGALFPDKSGTNSYAPDLARFLERFKLGTEFKWRLVLMAGTNSLYHDWVTNSTPGAGDEINFAVIRARLTNILKEREQERENALVKTKEIQDGIQDLSKQDLPLGTWLHLGNPQLASFNGYCKDAVKNDVSIQATFKDYLARVVDALHARKPNQNRERALQDEELMKTMLNAGDTLGVCRRLDGMDLLKREGMPTKRFFEQTVCRREQEEIKLKREEAAHKKLEQAIDAVKRQQAQVADGCWETISELQLRIEQRKPASTKKPPESAVFVKFEQPPNPDGDP